MGQEGEEIPLVIREFIKNYISSVGHLEVLSLLVEQPEKKWTAVAISKTLRTNPSFAEAQFKDLAGKKLIKCSGSDSSYELDQNSAEYEVLIELVSIYVLKRHTIISIIYQRPHELLQCFANAFKLKKD